MNVFWFLSRASEDPISAGLRTDLIAFWKLEEASGTRFDSVGSNDLTDNNTVAQVAGKIGNAAHFVAADSESLSINDNPALSMGDIDFTIAGWFNRELEGALSPLVWKFDLGSAEYVVFLQAGAAFGFSVSPDGSEGALATIETPGASPDTWHFFVVWHDATLDTINLQMDNGSVESTAHSAGVFDGSSRLFLGGAFDGAFGLTGNLDAIGIWKRVLTAAERAHLWNSGAGRQYPF